MEKKRYEKSNYSCVYLTTGERNRQCLMGNLSQNILQIRRQARFALIAVISLILAVMFYVTMIAIFAMKSALCSISSVARSLISRSKQYHTQEKAPRTSMLNQRYRTSNCLGCMNTLSREDSKCKT